MRGRKDNNIDFSITDASGNSVLFNGYNYEGIVQKIGTSNIDASIDICDTGESKHHILTLSPKLDGKPISRRMKDDGKKTNNWSLHISGDVGSKIKEGNFTGFRYWKLSWPEVKTPIGAFHKCVVDLDDRVEKEESVLSDKTQISINDNEKLLHIESMLERLCAEMGVL